MHPIDQLEAVVPILSGVVDDISADQLGLPTPCDEFTVHDVLDHVIVLGGTFAELFRGTPLTEARPPAAYGRVPAAELHDVLVRLAAAIGEEGAMERMLDTPVGTVDGETFARMVALDGLLHGWDLAVATGHRFDVDVDIVTAAHDFARRALTPDIRSTGMFADATPPPADASPLESLAAFGGRAVAAWRPSPSSLHVDKSAIPVRIAAPGAIARHLPGFGDTSGYTAMAGEYFSLGAGTDIAPLLQGLHADSCHAPHWGYMIEGELVVSFDDGSASTCRTGELFYWAPGHSVRVVADAEVILFSPAAEHAAVLDHMLEVMTTS